MIGGPEMNSWQTRSLVGCRAWPCESCRERLRRPTRLDDSGADMCVTWPRQQQTVTVRGRRLSTQVVQVLTSAWSVTTKSGLTFSAMNAAMSAGVIWPDASASCAAIMSSLDEENSRAMPSGSRKFR